MERDEKALADEKTAAEEAREAEPDWAIWRAQGEAQKAGGLAVPVVATTGWDGRHLELRVPLPGCAGANVLVLVLWERKFPGGPCKMSGGSSVDFGSHPFPFPAGLATTRTIVFLNLSEEHKRALERRKAAKA